MHFVKRLVYQMICTRSKVTTKLGRNDATNIVRLLKYHGEKRSVMGGALV